jgi:hypothetical protein
VRVHIAGIELQCAEELTLCACPIAFVGHLDPADRDMCFSDLVIEF